MTNQLNLAQPGQPQLIITPNPAFVDQPVQIRLTGFAPHQPVTIQAQMADTANQTWQSAATFITDAAGVIDVDAQPPLAGSYAEVDGMGLFWSMCLLDEGQEAVSFVNRELAPLTMHFTALVGEQAVAAATLQRLLLAPGITRTPVREQGLVGTLFQPAGVGPFPGILIFGGSEGGFGMSELRAALLARQGYAALALAYFACEHLPAALVNIPLEYFATAMIWLQAQPGVRADQLAVVGGSRGGELALLLGATFPQINAVVAYVPSNVLWGGFGSDEPDAPKYAWTYTGAPLPYMPEAAPELEKAILGQEVVVLTPLFLSTLADPALVERAAITVEKIKGPVLLIAGQDDQMWPSDQMAALVMQRLSHHRHPYPDQHLSYADVGHSIGLPYLPTTVTQSRHPIDGKVYAVGGKAQAYAAARADSWARVLAFLGEHSGR